MSARKLSLTAGLSPSYVSKVEAGEMDPSFAAFASIARVLEMSSWELVFCILFSDATMDRNHSETQS